MFLRQCGSAYLKATISPLVASVCNDTANYEIDPERCVAALPSPAFCSVLFCFVLF